MAKALPRKAPNGLCSQQLWRISNHADLTGAGGLRYSARWHTAGHPVVYLAETPAGALLEVLVHLELDENSLPRHYQLLCVSMVPSAPIPVTLIENLHVPAGNGWKRRVAITRAIGDAWLRGGCTPLARVPSAILPRTANYLLNPRHPQAIQFQIVDRQRARFDARLLTMPQVKSL